MNSKSHYDDPSVIRRNAISHFTEKYDTPNCYQMQNSINRRHSDKHVALRSAKSLGCLNSVNVADSNLLSESEMSQIEIFFRAHKSYIYVCRCLVNLYFTKTDLVNGGRTSKPRIHEWELSRTGVPVIIFDKGETKARDKRQLQICLAERGTGFVLWSDIIDNLSDYSAHHPCFHTLYLSSDHRKMAGLSFDEQLAAQQFHEQIETLTSDPLNIALTGPKKSGKKFRLLSKELSVGSGTANFKTPKKSDISSPCLFQHVTSVEMSDYEKLYSMSTLVPYALRTVSSVTPTSTSASTISSESNAST